MKNGEYGLIMMLKTESKSNTNIYMSKDLEQFSIKKIVM